MPFKPESYMTSETTEIQHLKFSIWCLSSQSPYMTNETNEIQGLKFPDAIETRSPTWRAKQTKFRSEISHLMLFKPASLNDEHSSIVYSTRLYEIEKWISNFWISTFLLKYLPGFDNGSLGVFWTEEDSEVKNKVFLVRLGWAEAKSLIQCIVLTTVKNAKRSKCSFVSRTKKYAPIITTGLWTGQNILDY